MKRTKVGRVFVCLVLLFGWFTGCSMQPPAQELAQEPAQASLGKTKAALGWCLTNTSCASNEFCRLPLCGKKAAGVCLTRPKSCPTPDPYGADEVCGCNGKSYGSVCLAAKAGVTSEPGPCPGKNQSRYRRWLSRVDTKACTGTTIFNGEIGHPVFTYIQPAAHEDGHYAAGRVVPKAAQSPFTVTQVRYKLRQQVKDRLYMAHCNARLGHEVQVFVKNTNQTPSMFQQPLATIQVPELNANNVPQSTDTRTITLTLPKPIRLKQGESIFISVKMRYVDANNVLCMGVCLHQVDPNLDFWSNAAQKPYQWTSLASFGPLFIMGYYVQAYGFYDGPKNLLNP